MASNNAAVLTARRAMRDRFVIAMATALLIGAFGCSGADSGTGPRNVDPTGIYALIQADSKRIPTEVYRGTYYDPNYGRVIDPFIVRVTGGEIILSDDGSFHMAIDFAFDAEGEESSTTVGGDGSYEIRGNQIALTGNAGTVVGQFSGGLIRLTINQGAGSSQLVFRYAP